MAASYWSCTCGERWPRTKQKCVCGKRRPKRRVPMHARTLRDDSYARYVEVAREIHGVTDESCCVCEKPRTQERHHDRDHDHVTGLPRGLACGGNRGCNVLMLPWITAAVAASIYTAKLHEAVEEAERWRLIAAYLRRVEVFYAVQGARAS